jgi:iron complex outermembrane receptor protein
MPGTQVRTRSTLRVRPLAAAVAAVLGSAYALPVVAQSGGTDARELPLEEIIVTAARRETSIQDVPFNIAAVSGQELERQRLTSLREFARTVPGLTVADQGPRAAELMTVRGLNVTSLNASEFLANSGGETVATYLGQIPLYVDFKMKDLERIEVLLGPQGTLYGEGTLAGAIRYIPTRPDTEQFSFDVHGSFYSLDQSSGLGYDTDFILNVPLSDSVAFRAAVNYLDDPGFIDYSYLVREPGVSNPQPDFTDPADVAANLYSVPDADTEQTVSSRLALLWQISDTLEATFNYYYQDQDAGGRTVNHRAAFGTDPYTSASRFPEPNVRENDLFSVEVVADFGFAELTSATGFSSYSELGQRDQTDLLLSFETGYEDFPSFAAFTREVVDEDRVNQELRLVSTGAGPWSWIGGVYYNDYEVSSSSEEFVPGLPEFFDLELPDDLEFRQIDLETLTETALFGEVGYQFTPQWQVTVGLRWFEYDNDNFTSVEAPLLFPGVDALGNSGGDDGVLGKLNTSYHFSDSIMGYFTISEGYRSGGVNALADCATPLPPGQNVCALPAEKLYDPDTTTNFELGVHSTWRDGTLLFNGALFRIDWSDIQTGSFSENGDIPITVNGSEARSQGVELSLQAPRIGAWSLAGTYAYTQAEMTDFAAGLVDGADAFPGDRLPGTPEHQGSVTAGYEHLLRNGYTLSVDYGLTYTSDVITKIGLRNDGETLESFTLHNAALGLHADRWSAVLFADNLTDEFAETAVRLDPSYIYSVGGFDLRRYYRHVIRPRSIGLEFRYRLGG